MCKRESTFEILFSLTNAEDPVHINYDERQLEREIIPFLKAWVSAKSWEYPFPPQGYRRYEEFSLKYTCDIDELPQDWRSLVRKEEQGDIRIYVLIMSEWADYMDYHDIDGGLDHVDADCGYDAYSILVISCPDGYEVHRVKQMIDNP